MRHAAMILGIIAGIIGIVIGFFSITYVTLVERYGEIPDIIEQFDRAGLIRVLGVIAPIVAIAGGAIAKFRGLLGGALMLVSALMSYAAYGWTLATMFPIAMCLVGAVLAIAAGKPDRPRAHF